MIWITGDKHGEIEAFNDNPDYRKIKKNDTLIVCGDFGFIWNGTNQEKKKLKKLSKKKFNIAFVDGCHENFELLEEYPIEDWNDGKVRRIAKNIFWLLRGECYNIENKKILTFGGGFITGDDQTNNKAILKKQAPTENQIENVIVSIEKNNGEFDAIITHEPPLSIKNCINEYRDEPSNINSILEEIRKTSTFKRWFFGSSHIDKFFSPLYRAVFNDVVKLDLDTSHK